MRIGFLKSPFGYPKSREGQAPELNTACFCAQGDANRRVGTQNSIPWSLPVSVTVSALEILLEWKKTGAGGLLERKQVEEAVLVMEQVMETRGN